MKKFCLITVIILVVHFSVDACNVCGCGVGNYHYGILPQFSKNFAGIRYRHYSYISTLDDLHANTDSRENFQTMELWGRIYPARRVQMFVFIPFNMNERIEGSHIKKLNGLGDIVISANFNLINTYDSTAGNLKHNLLVGGGVKLPTGRYRELDNGLTVNQNFQLGTGSIDFLFNMLYTVRYQNVGLNTELSYSYNTTNKDEYRFGNAARTGLTAFYIVRMNAITLMPNVGMSSEFFKDNKQFGVTFSDTGGWASLFNAGAELYYRKVALGFSYSHPGKQALFNGKVHANDRISSHVTFMF